MKMTYEVYTWKLSADTDPVLVERKKFTKFFDACDYRELMEEKGYECHLFDNESLKNLYKK
jgi:hypothetical protein